MHLLRHPARCLSKFYCSLTVSERCWNGKWRGRRQTQGEMERDINKQIVNPPCLCHPIFPFCYSHPDLTAGGTKKKKKGRELFWCLCRVEAIYWTGIWQIRIHCRNFLILEVQGLWINKTDCFRGMHILPLFEPELLHTDSYSSISRAHIGGIVKKNTAGSVDFVMQVKRAARDAPCEKMPEWQTPC